MPCATPKASVSVADDEAVAKPDENILTSDCLVYYRYPTRKINKQLLYHSGSKRVSGFAPCRTGFFYALIG